MTTRIPAMPYIEFVLDALRADNELVAHAWSKNLHWGYWASPESADVSVEGYCRAMDDLTRRHFLHLDLGPGKRIADVGCGLGGAVSLLNETFEGLDLVGVNIDARQLEHARANVKPRPGSNNRIDFVVADACELPFDDASLDAVLSVECIFHFSSRDRYLAEIRRVLKPGGRLVVSDFVARPLRLPLLALLYLPFHSAVRGTYGDAAPPPTRGLYRRLATRNGLELMHVDDVTPNTLPNYQVLPTIVSQLGEQGAARRAVRFLEYATRLGVYTYDILTFRTRE
ncbi:MAG TPA: class I SAM-dependent methyltransferase [Polyangiaceae bacterium]|nr:class I SAM-dependent methyltransferase [Polyangiaceae bacterium]